MMQQRLCLLLGYLVTLSRMGSADQLFLGSDYSAQQGIVTEDTTIHYFDDNDYMVYSSVNFGSSGSIKGFLINYAKSTDNGSLEIREGSGVNGQLIAKISPASTSSWHTYRTAYVGLLTEISGVHNITFVGKDVSGLMNLAWFELSDFTDRIDVEHARIPATEYSDQSGTRIGSSGNVGYFDNNDFVTYAQVNFGEVGTSDGIRFHYSKNNLGGRMEIRKGGPTGTLLATFPPTSTNDWQMYRDTYIGLDDISGVHDITFVAKDSSGVLNFMWFEPTKRSADLNPFVLATEFSDQSGLRSTYDKLGYFDDGDYATYSNLNFGPSFATKAIVVSYAKANTGGTVEIRLDGPQGDVIATFAPHHTGGWDTFVTAHIPIDLVEGVHDITFVGRDVQSVWDPRWFELSSQLLFTLETDYKVDDNDGKDIQCTYDTVQNAYTDQVYNRYYSNSGTSAENKFIAHLGVSSKDEAMDYVKNNLCGAAQQAMEGIPLDDITVDQGSQFIELYYSGRGSWNEETETKLYPGSSANSANVLKDDAYMVNDYKAISEKAMFKMPNLAQFDPNICTARAAQCCWPRDRQANDNNGNCGTPYDSDCIDKDVADNTDLCYNELGKAPYTNGIDANGFSTYDHEGPVHCHGFAWSTDEQEISTRYKANALFFVSMYDHMYQRGYVENIPNSPMCGCVEHMPTVSRSDCTQTNVKEYYTFYEDMSGSGFSSIIDEIKLQYQACQGANGNNNDLSAFVQQLVNDGKLSTTEQDIFEKHVVGIGNCQSVVEELWEDSGFKRGHDINYDEWTFIVGESYDSETPIYDKRLFREMFEAQDIPIVRRVCPSCKTSHKDIYYRRLIPMPDDFDLLDTLMNNWSSTDNKLNEHFSLHSTYLDAYYGINGWTYCNYDDPGIGFPRDCGPHGRVNFQWNSFSRGGGQANYHAFMIPADPNFVSTYEPPLFPKLKGIDYSYQVGTISDGEIIGYFDDNDYLIYTSINFGSTFGITKGILLNYAKGNYDDGELEVRLGSSVNGQLIAKISPAPTDSWFNYITAHMGLLTEVSGVHDVTFVGKGASGVLNLASFELSDFSDRTDSNLARIPVTEYSNQSGLRFIDSIVMYWDDYDYITYANVNFGVSGTTSNIKLNYSKGNNNGGVVEIRSGGSTGTLLATFNPTNTGGWGIYSEVTVPISATIGVQDITFVGRNADGIMNLKWFELTS